MAIIGFAVKSSLAAIPALGDVMGKTGYDETWHSGHNLPPCKSFNRDDDITRCRPSHFNKVYCPPNLIRYTVPRTDYRGQTTINSIPGRTVK